jgi:hypothetical protein
LSDRNKTLWGGWAVLGADFHWYFTGDTGYSKDFKDVRERLAARHTPEQGGGGRILFVAGGRYAPIAAARGKIIVAAVGIRRHFTFAHVALDFCSMGHTYENVMHQLQLGEELIAAAVDELVCRWQASVTVIGKICTEADRWKAVLHQMQAPVNFADILRARAPR